MKPREIILITLCVIASFLMAEFFIVNLVFHGAFQRLVLRVGFLSQILVLIYLFFDSRDISNRLTVLEKLYDKLRRASVKLRSSRVLKRNKWYKYK